jgi:hypothetical protein
LASVEVSATFRKYNSILIVAAKGGIGREEERKEEEEWKKRGTSHALHGKHMQL